MQNKSISRFTLWLIVGLAVLFVLSLAQFLFKNYQAGDSAPWQLITSGLILSIPLALFYGAIGLLAECAFQRRAGCLDERLAKLVLWSPRIAAMLLIFFVSLFALDVFSPEYTLAEMLVGFLMHMLPSIAMIILLVLAWRWAWVGFFAFLAAALYFMRFALGDLGQAMGSFLLFSGPMLLIAILFGVSWLWRRDLVKPG